MVDHSPKILASEEKKKKNARARALTDIYTFVLSSLMWAYVPEEKTMPVHEDCHILCLKTKMNSFFSLKNVGACTPTMYRMG